jgi:hypothetical protein
MENFDNIEDALQFIARNQRKIDNYNRKLQYISNYQKENPDKCRERCKRYYEKLKEDPVKFLEFTEKKKKHYLEKKEKSKPIINAVKLD